MSSTMVMTTVAPVTEPPLGFESTGTSFTF
jgi:hypothetical protein